MSDLFAVDVPRRVQGSYGYFIKFDKIWLFLASAAARKRTFSERKGQPGGAGWVENGVDDAFGRGRNPAQRLRDGEGVGKAGLVRVQIPFRIPVKGRRRLRIRGLGRSGLGFRGGNEIVWLLARGLRLPAAPLSFVYLWLGGRGRGLRLGWGETAVRNQAFDGYDHRKGLDLTGHRASGGFGAEIGQLPEPGQDLVATKVQLAQAFGFLVYQPFPDGGAVFSHVGADAGLGFGVGSGVGIETDGFRGAAVIHGSGHDQVSKGHFLIGDGIADSIFGHR